MEIELENTEILLKKVSDMVNMHEEEKKLAKESFNFFKILGIEHKETYHSKIIAELLNPKGSHGCGSIFADIFCEILNQSFAMKYGTLLNSSQIKVELFMGDISETYEEGGRADIVIVNGRESILIENKIFASDQKNQIKRYHHFKNTNFKDHTLSSILYLTPDGRNPSAGSHDGLKDNIDFYCISYKKHVLEWLEKCIEKSNDHPTVKETIKGYLTVIKFW